MALAVTVLVRDAVDIILKPKEDCNLLMIIAIWFIWNERNLIREEGQEECRFFCSMYQSPMRMEMPRRRKKIQGQSEEPLGKGRDGVNHRWDI